MQPKPVRFATLLLCNSSTSFIESNHPAHLQG